MCVLHDEVLCYALEPIRIMAVSYLQSTQTPVIEGYFRLGLLLVMRTVRLIGWRRGSTSTPSYAPSIRLYKYMYYMFKYYNILKVMHVLR